MPRYSQTYGQRHFACFMSCSTFWVYHHILDSVGFSTVPEKPRKIQETPKEIHVSRSASFSKYACFNVCPFWDTFMFGACLVYLWHMFDHFFGWSPVHCPHWNEVGQSPLRRPANSCEPGESGYVRTYARGCMDAWMDGWMDVYV